MKLRPFTEETLQQWRDTGYQLVKLTPSEDMSVNNVADGPFTLLEPFLNEDQVAGADRVVSIHAPEVAQIIADGSGMHYQ